MERISNTSFPSSRGVLGRQVVGRNGTVAALDRYKVQGIDATGQGDFAPQSPLDLSNGVRYVHSL
jgi:hypothetical protein